MSIRTSQSVPPALPRITRRHFLTTAGVGVVAVLADRSASAAEPRFPATISAAIGGKTVRLALTGTALRTKYLFRVYTVASYVLEGITVPSAEALARLDAPKRLILAFERDVDGATMASSFRDSIGRANPAPSFAAELTTLERYFVANPVRVGDRIALTHIPGAGLGVGVNTRPAIVIPSVRFAQSAWGTYLGPDPLDVALKANLMSRLR